MSHPAASVRGYRSLTMVMRLRSFVLHFDIQKVLRQLREWFAWQLQLPNLTASVGRGGVNSPADVKVLQKYLVLLGFSWVATDGIFGPQTEQAIRLFQGIVRGARRLDAPGIDGLISVPGPTYDWLRARNSPRWVWQPLGSTSEGFYNVEHAEPDDADYGTIWLAEAVRQAGACYKTYYDGRIANGSSASLILINDVSPLRGGPCVGHRGHQTGLDFDLRLPRKTGGTAGGLTYSSPDYDREAMREILQCFRAQPAVVTARFNDPVLISENLCVGDSTGAHDNHAHIEIGVPARLM